MKESKDNKSCAQLPEIIQGGMGAGVSNWCLARAVASCGELGVVSGTALDSVMIRRLQVGDQDGSTRRALAAFPYQQMVEPILEKWFIPGGKAESAAFKLKAMPTADMSREEDILLIVANFVEVFLAKEGHDGMIGINFLEKIQLPTLASLFGAMLAGVDVVLMGGGIPLAIPGVLDALSRLESVELKVNLTGPKPKNDHFMTFDPGAYVPEDQQPLKRPLFFAIISSDILAKTLVRKASGKVDGFVVEHHSAGGHNAPPRREGAYGERDVCNLARVAELGLPFWLAGGVASPAGLAAAKGAGAQGVQVGTAFACSEESGILPEYKKELMQRYYRDELNVTTDFQASPTGYPFKRAELSCNEVGEDPCRVCDLGYLRHVYEKEDGTLGYRCPAGPEKSFLSKGGSEKETEGKHCLCNGLVATIGLGQIRKGQPVLPLVTLGDDLSFLYEMLTDGRTSYSAKEMVAYLKSAVPATAAV